MTQSKSPLRKSGPVNLDLLSIMSYYLPLPGIVSIMHRISGALVFVLIPLLLWMLQSSLASADSFATLQNCLQHPLLKLLLWAVVSALLFHLIAGIRHLLMDAGIGETIISAQIAAKITLAISIILVIGTGVWLW